MLSKFNCNTLGWKTVPFMFIEITDHHHANFNTEQRTYTPQSIFGLFNEGVLKEEIGSLSEHCVML